MRRKRRFPATSVMQNKLYHYIRLKYPEAVLNLPVAIPLRRYYRYADVALPSHRIDFEYDGQKYHRKQKDDQRDLELETAGWATVRVNKTNFWTTLENLEEIVKRVSRLNKTVTK